MGVPGPSVGGFLKGRANRREFWLMIAIVLALSFTALSLIPGLQTAGTVAVTFAQIRRLHDLGRTGWWVAAILGLQLVAVVGLFAAGLPEDTILLLGTVVSVVPPIVILGAIAGQPFENRFGPAPGRRSLREIFS